MSEEPTGLEPKMLESTITRHNSLQDRQGRTIADVLNQPEQPFDTVLDFSICEGRERRMQESEIRHDRAPLAEVVREPESQSPIDDALSSNHPQSTKRLRQAMGVVARLGMEHHGWKETGKTSSLWVFEHRWPHLRDHAEGRNHRLQSN
jgi:hypothetical protein